MITLAHYSLPASLKKEFDSKVPARERSKRIASMMVRFFARAQAVEELKKKYGFRDDAELGTHPDRNQIFFELEMSTRRISKELARAAAIE